VKTPWRKLYALSIAGALSWLGSSLTTFAVVLRDKDTIGAGGVSLYLVAFALPTILMAPISGVIVDKFSSRAVVLPALAIMGASSLTLALGWPVWWTPIALLITATAGTVVGPAMQAAQVVVTDPADIPRVTGLMQSTASAGMLFAPALGGILVSTTGYVWPFVIDAVSFWLLGIAFVAIGINRNSVEHVEGEKLKAIDGLKFVGGDRLIRALVVLVASIVIALGAYNVGEVFLIKDELHASTFIYGLVGALFAAGSIIGSVLTAAIKLPSNRHALAVVIGLSTIVVSMFGLALAWNWWVPMVLSFIAGVGNSALNAYAIGIIMTRTASDMLGRVLAAIGAVISAGSVLGVVVSGIAISVFHVRPVLLVGAILCTVLMVIFSP
jgi:MFS family permease